MAHILPKTKSACSNSVMVALISLIAMTGCGQTGALYLKDTDRPQPIPDSQALSTQQSVDELDPQRLLEQVQADPNDY